MNLIQSCDIATPFEVWVQIFPMNVNGERLCNSFNKDPVKWDVEARLCNVEPNGKEWDTVGGTTAWGDTKSFLDPVEARSYAESLVEEHKLKWDKNCKRVLPYDEWDE